MKIPPAWLIVAFLGLGPAAFGQESVQEASGTTRRPRIRTYNQKVKILPLGEPAPSENGGRSAGVDPEILRERSTQRDRQFGISQITSIPLMTPNTNRASRSDEEEEDNDNWINPLDLLPEDDLDNLEDLLKDESPEDGEDMEMEILDWENLGEDMIERELRNSRAEEDTQADAKEDFERESVRRQEESSPSDTGLGLSSLESSANEIVEVGGVDASGASGEYGRRPLLESALRMEGPPVMNDPRAIEDLGDTAEPEELAGSRGMLNEVRERWRPASAFERPETPAAGSFHSPDVSTGTSTVDRPTLRMEAVSLQPATVVRRPEPAAVPELRMTGRSGGAEAPSTPNLERSRFRRDEGRIRSLIGETP